MIDPIHDVPTPTRLLAGPGDAVFLVGSQDDAELRIWWPTSRHLAVVPLTLDEDIELAYFDHQRDQLVVIAIQVYAIPWRAIACHAEA